MSTSTQPLKIFLVDDDPFFIGMLEEYLAGFDNLQVKAFSSSSECLKQLTEEPNLILLDYNMDNLNGLDILKKIKRFNPDLIVVFISGQHKINVAVDALKFGAFDYLLKDEVNEKKLMLMLEKVNQFREVMKSKQKGGLSLLLKNFGISL